MRIAFFGKMGSGKTTAANYLVDKYGFQRVSLASPVKAIGAIRDECFPDDWPRELAKWADVLLPDPVYGDEVRHWPDMHGTRSLATTREMLVYMWREVFDSADSRRELLQRIGTDAGRTINPEIWINYFARNLPDGNLVVDDLRFENELEAMKDLGFTCVRLEIRESQRVDRLTTRDGDFDPATQGHQSETELVNMHPDKTIYNNYGLAQLFQEIDGMIRAEWKGLNPPNTLDNLVDQAYDNATKKGFHEVFYNAPDQETRDLLLAGKIALIHSELSELLEGYRDGDQDNVGEELADVLIRCFDLAGVLNLSLDREVKAKMERNLERPVMHGKRF